ncbi:MAG: type IV pilus secretin PilQ [Burkholderiales bacterium]
MRKITGCMIGVALALAHSAAALAQNAIQSLAASNQAGRVVFRVELSEPLAAAPASFTVAQPPRIAFDFPNTANGTGRTTQTLNEGELRSVSMVQVGNRTRMVLNLSNMMTYESRVDGKFLEVVMNATASATAARAPAKAERFAEDQGAQDGNHAIKDIDFRRGPNGEGRIVVELSDSRTGIDIRQQGSNLVVDFMRTQAPENLRRRLNVTDFATPVQTVNTFPQGGNTRMLIEPKGLWEHNAYQTDTQFVIEVKPVQFDPNKLVQGSRGGYKGDKLSLNFQNIDVRSVLNVIADFTDLNIITSDTVQGNLTLRLKEVPWDQALDIILQTRGLDMRKNGNVIWIAPRDELATKEKLELEARNQISDLEPVRTETFQINYSKAAEIAKIIGDDKQKMLSKRGSVVVDPRSNQLFVQDITVRLEEVRRIIAKVDVPVRQVMIEARIVEAEDQFRRTVGARLGLRDARTLGGARTGTGGGLADTAFPNQIVSPNPNFFKDTLNVNLPGQNLAAGQSGQFSFVLFNKAATRFLNLEISALEADRKAKIISSPRVVTSNQVEASIEDGEEIPFQQATSSGATSVSFKKATLSLKVKPQITPEGTVILDVVVNKDSRGDSVPGGVAINTRNVKSQVLVENGGTVVIGGIYLQNESTEVAKIPFLGDLPVVGNLFRNQLRQDSKRELLVFLTPRIIDDSLSIR